MSQTHTEHAHLQHGDDKKHGDALESAMKDADTHNTEGAAADPVPTPDKGAHSHSHAAHLADTDTREASYEAGVREGANPNTLRQPPPYQERAGRATKGS